MDAKVNGGFEDGRFLFRDGLVRDVEAFSISAGKTIITDTGTVATVGSIVRFEDGPYQYQEFTVVEVLGANQFAVAGELPLLTGVENFFILKRTSQRVDDTGAQVTIAIPGPTQFVLDGVDTEVNEDTVVPANSRPFPVKAVSSYLSSVRLDYSVTNVDNTLWTQLVASTGANVINSILLFDGGGYAMELGIGAAAAEVRTLLIPPGGFNGPIPFFIPINSRISIRAIGAALVNLGEIDINFMR